MKWKSIQTKQVLLNILLHQQGQNNVITNQKTFDLHLWRAVTVFPKEQQIYQTEAKRFTRYSLLFICCFLLITRYFLLVTFYLLLVTFYSLLVTFYSLLATFYSLFITFYSLLVTFTRYFLLFTCYSLLFTRY